MLDLFLAKSSVIPVATGVTQIRDTPGTPVQTVKVDFSCGKTAICSGGEFSIPFTSNLGCQQTLYLTSLLYMLFIRHPLINDKPNLKGFIGDMSKHSMINSENIEVTAIKVVSFSSFVCFTWFGWQSLSLFKSMLLGLTTSFISVSE